MRFQYTGRKLNIRDSFKERTEKKLAKLERIFSEDAIAYITVTAEKNFQTVEVTISESGMFIRAEAQAPDMESALDEVVDILGGQIRKHKTKLGKRLRSGAIEQLTSNDEEREYQVLRSKTFPVKPLSVEEAILQMNMLGHQFFVFQNAETMRTNVVYRRKSGGYGLLQPEDSTD